MSLPGNLFSPTFKRQHLGWLFTAIMAIMVYLATLAMALQATVSSTGLNWDQQQRGLITIELPPSSDGESAQQAEKVGKILTILMAMPEVKEAKSLPEAEAIKLLQPWIKDAEFLKTLPLPSLIDVQLHPGKLLSAEAIKSSLKAITNDVRINDHAEWLDRLHKIVYALAALGWLLILLTGIALMVAVSLICRAAMAVEHKTIDLLHTMGATDETIAQAFAAHACKLSWPAAVIGFALAILTLCGFAFLLQYFVISEISMDEKTWIIPAIALSAVPFIAVIGSIIMARTAVLGLLRKQP
ncbi:MAG: hypothetical protein PHX43_04315 [Alphaproteobacteria bacterium]|nr:hypothetical protein [Alphaproteobacteria bacterium]